MPELPEVETTKRGIKPHLLHQRITDLIVRNKSLRWPVPDELRMLIGYDVIDIERRAKYLRIKTEAGDALVHLGMSGSLKVVSIDEPPSFHDHVDLIFEHFILRYTDPRRFGCWLYLKPNEQHTLLSKLGPEPLSEAFSADYFYSQASQRKTKIKQFIMNNAIVVGVGNIYANEALFMSGIHPSREAKRISRARLYKLHQAIIDVLRKAIENGGTTLKDFVNSDGKPGYFKQQLNVYGRAGKACLNCNKMLKEIRQGGRSTVYCASCQR